jgi:hypothetical protein
VASTHHVLRTLRASLRSAKWPRTQFANSPKYKYKVPKVQVSKIQVFYGQVHTRMPFKRWKCYSPTSRQAKVLVVQASVAAYLQDSLSRFFATICSTQESEEFILTSYVQGQLFKCPQPRIPFFGSRVAVFTSNLSCLKYWLLHHFLFEEAMCKGSTGNRLLHAAKAVP